MIFAFFPRVAVKFGPDERHVFDRAKLMFSEVQEIEKVTGLSYAEWEDGLRRYSITAVAALLHVLRKRDGMPSDFGNMNFAAADLDCIPIHDDDREYTGDEVAAEVSKLLAPDANGVGPTRAADGPGSPSGETGSTPRQLTNPSSPNGSASAPGNGNGSPTPTSSPASPISTSS